MTIRDTPGRLYVDRFVFALRHFGPAAHVRHVLREIAVYADWDKGTAFVGGERLAEGLAVTRQTVSQAVRAAVNAGWLSVRKAPAPRRSGKNWGVNEYRLLIPPEAELQVEEWEARQDSRQAKGGASNGEPSVVHNARQDSRRAKEACRASSDACQDSRHERVSFPDTNLPLEPSEKPSKDDAPRGARSIPGEDSPPDAGPVEEVAVEVEASTRPKLTLVRIEPPPAEPAVLVDDVVVQEVEPGPEPEPWNGYVLLKGWLDYRTSKGLPPLGPADKGKFGACAARIAKQYTREEVAAAVIGIEALFPHSKGEPWDLMDLERKFAKAIANAANHPDVKRARFLAEMEAAG